MRRFAGAAAIIAACTLAASCGTQPAPESPPVATTEVTPAAEPVPTTTSQAPAPPATPAPAPPAANVPAPLPAVPAVPKPAPAPRTTTRAPAPPASVYYANCAAAKAAGAAPLHRGEPGYRAGLDRDDDGVACE